MDTICVSRVNSPRDPVRINLEVGIEDMALIKIIFAFIIAVLLTVLVVAVWCIAGFAGFLTLLLFGSIFFILISAMFK